MNNEPTDTDSKHTRVRFLRGMLPWGVGVAGLVYYGTWTIYVLLLSSHYQSQVADLFPISYHTLNVAVVLFAAVLAFGRHPHRKQCDTIVSGVFALEAIMYTIGLISALLSFVEWGLGPAIPILNVITVLTRGAAVIALAFMVLRAQSRLLVGLLLAVFVACSSYTPVRVLPTVSFEYTEQEDGTILRDEPENSSVITAEEAIEQGIISAEDAGDAVTVVYIDESDLVYWHPNGVAYILYGLIALYLFWIRPKWIAAEQAVDE